MIEPPEPIRIPDQWVCQECGDSMGYILDRKYGTELTDKEVYSLCVPCFIKRSRVELTASVQYAVDKLRALGFDVDARVDGEAI